MHQRILTCTLAALVLALAPIGYADGVTVPASVVSAGITDDTIVNADINTSAAIAISKLGATTAGNGAAVTGKSTAAETVGEIKCTTLTLSFTETATDGSDEGESEKVYDFAAGNVTILAAIMNASMVSAATATGAVLYVSCGTAAAGDDNDLTSTEANIIPRTTLDPSAAGITTNTYDAILAAPATFDGTATAVDLYCNLAIDDDNMAGGNPTFALSGTLTLIYVIPVDNQ